MSDSKMTHEQLAGFIRYLDKIAAQQYKASKELYWTKMPKGNTDYYQVWIDEAKDIPGEFGMTGTEYIQQRYGDERARYKHMRGMLQEIWNIQHKHPNARFDIDGNFGYDAAKIAAYIEYNASNNEINQAHEVVRNFYRNKGRGRPKGARNIDKVTGSDTLTVNLDEMINELSEPTPLKQIEPPKTNGHDAQQNFSSDELRNLLVKYVTHEHLDGCNYVNESDLVLVAQNLQKALTCAFTEFEKTIKINQPTIIELKRANDLPNIELGVQHRCFKQLLLTVQATLRNGNRVIPWVYGPAGTGKSVAAENVAKALGLPFHCMGTTLAKFEILGFVNTTGYQTTPFREAYEHGGVFCADEMDSWAKEATVALNNGLANSHCTFADKMVQRHPNFVMIACANTTGSGATLEFVGRNKQDGATLNRFVHIYWPLDEALEDCLVANKDWLKYVRNVRARVSNSNLNPKPLITPRASLFGETLLNSGMERETVIDMCLRQGLSDAQWGQIK